MLNWASADGQPPYVGIVSANRRWSLANLPLQIWFQCIKIPNCGNQTLLVNVKSPSSNYSWNSCYSFLKKSLMIQTVFILPSAFTWILSAFVLDKYNDELWGRYPSYNRIYYNIYGYRNRITNAHNSSYCILYHHLCF